MSVKPRKRFGQHFLTDATIIERVIQTINPQPDQTLIEIGPGLGAITEPLLKAAGKLIALELDRDVIPHLRAHCHGLGQLDIINVDVLNYDFKALYQQKKLHIVGNLPYNISTPLMFHLFKFLDIIQSMHFMLQKEVADRLTAQVNTKQYGRLSIMAQYHCHITELFDVPPQAFKPAPKVFSSIVELTPRTNLPEKAKDYTRFELLVREAFNHRRKTLQNSLKGYIDSDDFVKVGIDPKRRAETLTVEEFITLANLF
ncbi:MAG: 16S rRNA (adenine(1518)-N(6)/adenine(1519)-N(6))-dimethyltransferase RsmA [Pseudomonadota bacterium]